MLQTECESGFVVSIPLYLSLVPQSSKQQTDRDDFFRHGRFHCHNSFVNPPLARARVKLITVSAYST